MSLNRWIVAAALLGVPSGGLQAATLDELEFLKEQLHELDQKVRILERNKELETEVMDARSKTVPSVTFGSGGLQVSTADTNFTLKLRGYLQADSRFFTSEDVKGNDTFLLRRVRPVLEGTVWRNFEYRLMTDFGSGISSGSGNNGFLQDAYVNVHYWDAAQVQLGKFKEPVGLERLQSGANLLFIERGLPTQLVPNRDVGVQLHGQAFGKALAYQIGVFNGVEDGASGDIETTDDGKDVAARIFAHPFALSTLEPFKKLGIGIAATHGRHAGGLRNYATAGQQTWFRWRTGAGTEAAPSVVADGATLRIVPQAYWYWGPFGVFGEYAISSHEVQRTAGALNAEDRLRNEAWQVAVSLFLTGEDNSFTTVTPKKPFSVYESGWGAWELAARVGSLKVDEDAFPNYATPASAREVREWAVGVNWHLNRNVKASVNYIDTDFRGGDESREEAMLGRIQLSF